MNIQSVPLCVDLDGTLTLVDTLQELLLDMARREPAALLRMPFWLLRGKAWFKAQAARYGRVDAQVLPYREDLLEWLRKQKASGRRLVLATAANEAVARRVAQHLALFDEVHASDDRINLSGAAKRDALVKRFGERGFDYVGNARTDLRVWSGAREAVVVGGGRGLARLAARLAAPGPSFAAPRAGLRTWLRALRIHQWVKNLLMFVPLLMAHRFADHGRLVGTAVGFGAFCLCASSVYLLNDLLDLVADRHHPRKRLRPFASGALPEAQGLALALLLLVAAVSIEAWMGRRVLVVLLSYYFITLGYSLRFKRVMVLDVMLLAVLYTLRIIAGAAAGNVVLSFWLLGFSCFVFLSLGIVKRCTELGMIGKDNGDTLPGRGYQPGDLPILATFGVAAGYAAVVILALYINSPQSQLLYSQPVYLWLLCPLLLFWISRIWFLTHRGQMHDDPVVFALRDRTSFVVALLGLIIILAAA
jgi:4-hydroxybenzoate polyprenyltransferase/phosphoserine phosphatase